MNFLCRWLVCLFACLLIMFVCPACVCVGLKFLVAKAFWPVSAGSDEPSMAMEMEAQSKAVASERCKYLPRDKYAQLKFDLIQMYTQIQIQIQIRRHTHHLKTTDMCVCLRSYLPVCLFAGGTQYPISKITCASSVGNSLSIEWNLIEVTKFEIRNFHKFKNSHTTRSRATAITLRE